MSSIIQTILENLPLRKPVDKVISSTRSGTELRAFIQKFRPFVDDVQTAITDLNERVTDATSTTVNLDLAALNLPPDIQSEVHLHVTNLTIGNPDGDGGTYPQPPTEYWDDSVNAVEFFVDTTGGGSDTNDGLSELTPFATVEKAIQALKIKKISWNYNTFIRIKGTIQAPLDFRGIFDGYTTANKKSVLTVNKWESETEPWVFENNQNTDFARKSCILVDDLTTGIGIYNANFRSDSSFDFEGGYIEIDSCTASPLANSFSAYLAFSECVAYVNALTWDLSLVQSLPTISVAGTSSRAILTGLHSFQNGDYNNTAYSRVSRGGILDAQSLSVSGLTKSIFSDGALMIYEPSSNSLSIENPNTCLVIAN